MVAVLFQGPDWFFGVDAAVQAVAGITSLLVFLFSFRYARISKDPRFKTLGWGFLLLGLSFLTDAALRIRALLLLNPQDIIGSVTRLLQDLLFAYVSHILLFIAGLTILALWALRINEPLQRALIGAIITLLALTSFDEPMMHGLLATVLLIFITMKFLANAREQNTSRAWQVLLAFMLMTLAQCAFLLEPVSKQWYVGGNIIQLAGSLVLLLVLIQVSRR